MITPEPLLAVVYPLPPHQSAQVLAMLGLSTIGLPTAPAAPGLPGSSLTKVQGEIVVALTRTPPLNERQVAILEIYWTAYTQGEPPLPIETVATRLAAKAPVIAIDPTRAADYVKGALRSFGKRLFGALTRVPVQIGRDRMGDGVADEIPLLAMFSIEKGLSGEARHRLTPDGAAAVAAALALNAKGEAASSPAAEGDDPDEIVTFPIRRSTAALVMRVANSKEIGLDEALRVMTALAGAG